MESIEIIKARIEDLPEVLKLQKLCYKENALRYNDFKIPPLTQTLDELEKEFNLCTLLKAVCKDKIIGSIRGMQKDKTCFIGRLVVHPEYQNKGIGKKLMSELELLFNEVQRFELFTGFRDEKNLYLYEKLGFKRYKKERMSDSVEIIFLEKKK